MTKSNEQIIEEVFKLWDNNWNQNKEEATKMLNEAIRLTREEAEKEFAEKIEKLNDDLHDEFCTCGDDIEIQPKDERCYFCKFVDSKFDEIFKAKDNCEICKDYPKEYWCGNPKNKLSLKEQEVSKKIIDKMNERWGKDKLFMANLGKRIHELKLQLSEKDKLLSSLQEKIEDWIKRNKTSWEYLKKHGFPEAKEYGDCIFLNYKLNFPESLSAEEELQKIFQEKT
jgi:hypothetical protein